MSHVFDEHELACAGLGVRIRTPSPPTPPISTGPAGRDAGAPAFSADVNFGVIDFDMTSPEQAVRFELRDAAAYFALAGVK